jgi:thymidylate synthase ThyX
MRVRLLWCTPNPEFMVALAMRRCYNSKPIEELEKELQSRPGYERELIAKALRDKTFDVIEHAVFMFEIEGVSRILTHQLVRHRIASYDQECFDDETEILTALGWKSFNQISKEDRFATLNLANDRLEYQGATSIFKGDYEGMMFNVESDQISTLVTPNHRMLVGAGDRGRRRWAIRRALDLADRSKIEFKKGVGNWEGSIVDFIDPFVLPGAEIHKMYGSSGTTYVQRSADILIEPSTFMEFMGYYISEGSFCELPHPGGYRYVVTLAQTRSDIVPLIQDCLHKLPFAIQTCHKNDGRTEWSIQDKSLFEFLSPLGKSWQKYIPRELLSRPRSQLLLLFNALMKGDGDYRKNRYYTSSPRLANDVQELALKLGFSANIYSHVRPGNHGQRRREYCVNFIMTRNSPEVKAKGSSRKKRNFIGYTPYKGMIWCVEVPNGIVYVRRNGKPMWSGNSQRFSAVEKEDFIIPHSIQSNPEALEVYQSVLKASIGAFKRLKELEVPKEDARFVLPQSIGTKLVITANARSLMHFFFLRMATQAQWEIRELAELMLAECRKVAPSIFKDIIEA